MNLSVMRCSMGGLFFRQRKRAVSMGGFSLLEMMLVLAIIGGIMTVAINFGTRKIAQQRRDKAAIQMQQILNAGLAYYTAYGAWPSSCGYDSQSYSGSWSGLSTLSSAGYLPTSLGTNPFGYPYYISCDSITGSVFYVRTQTPSSAEATVVAGEVPVGYASDGNGNPSAAVKNYVVAQVTIPGQDLNNARSVNFAGIYNHGGCVPVPECPGYDSITMSCKSGSNCMTPEIIVAPVAMSGANDADSSAYPITSFTAYATAPAMNNPVSCSGGGHLSCISGVASPNNLYWRVCLKLVTQKGTISNIGNQYAALMVITRCTPPNEPYGSAYSSS